MKLKENLFMEDLGPKMKLIGFILVWEIKFKAKKKLKSKLKSEKVLEIEKN